MSQNRKSKDWTDILMVFGLKMAAATWIATVACLLVAGIGFGSRDAALTVLKYASIPAFLSISCAMIGIILDRR